MLTSFSLIIFMMKVHFAKDSEELRFLTGNVNCLLRETRGYRKGSVETRETSSSLILILL